MYFHQEQINRRESLSRIGSGLSAFSLGLSGCHKSEKKRLFKKEPKELKTDFVIIGGVARAAGGQSHQCVAVGRSHEDAAFLGGAAKELLDTKAGPLRRKLRAP